MKEGFGTMRLVIDCGAEAWKEPDMLVRTETAVVLPPFPSQGRTTDQALMPLETPKKLAEAGIVFALSAHDGGDASARLDVQAGFAMRGGLSREAALAAVTITPARMLGIDERVGSVEVGKDADLVLWNGEPFEVTSKPVACSSTAASLSIPADLRARAPNTTPSPRATSRPKRPPLR